MSNIPVSVIENTLKFGDLDVKTFQRSDWIMPSVWCFKCEYSNDLKEYLTSKIYDKTYDLYPIFINESISNEEKKIIMCNIAQSIIFKTHTPDRDYLTKIKNLDIIYKYLYDLIKKIFNDIHFKVGIIFNSYESINFDDYLIYDLKSRLFTEQKTRFSSFHTNFQVLASIRVITYILGFIDDITYLNVALNRNMVTNWGSVDNNTHAHIIKKVEMNSDFNTVVWDDFNMLHRTPVLEEGNLPRFFFSTVYYHKTSKIPIIHNGTHKLSEFETDLRKKFIQSGNKYSYYMSPDDYIKPLDDILKDSRVEHMSSNGNLQQKRDEIIGRKYKLLNKPLVRMTSQLNSKHLTQNIHYKKNDTVTIYDIEKITKNNGVIVYRCRITPKNISKSHWITLSERILEQLPNNEENNNNDLYEGGNIDRNKYGGNKSIYDKINKFTLKTLQEYAK